MNKLKLLDLFSGIGGFSLGLESTGYFQTIAFVEKDKYCRQVLQKNFKNIPIEEDIRNVRGSNYAADVITGGFPCQPFSVAGKRKGTADDRYLWDETIRVVAECKPSWFIGENVEGLININNGVVLRQVQTDLEEQGFQVQCLVIPAAGIGAWHQRKRVWIVAYSDSNRHSNKIRRSSTKEERISQEHRQDYNTTRKSSGASSVWETNNQHVPNPSSQRPFTRNNREMETKTRDKKETGDQSSLQTLSSCSDVPNTHNSRDRTSQNDINKEWEKDIKGREELTQFKSSGHSKDVSNSNSRLRRGRGTEFKNRDDREGWFYSEEEKQTRNDIRSEVIGCNAILGEDVSNSKSKGSFSTNKSKPSSEEQTRLDINEKKNWSEIWSYASRCNEQVGGRKATIQHTNSERCEELNISQKSNGQNFHSGEFNSTETTNKTWWQTQSEFCGVPNGVSYELDKDRSSRIKALGNSIVPQIARQIGLSIMKGELTNNE
jgi:DNA-cytosine methyltransferase